MTLSNNPKRESSFRKTMAAMPSAVTVFLVGHKITPFESPWSTMTRRESKPLERGRSVIRSYEICLKGRAVLDVIGDSGGAVGCVLTLFCWQMAQPVTYQTGLVQATSNLRQPVAMFSRHLGGLQSRDHDIVEQFPAEENPGQGCKCVPYS